MSRVLARSARYAGDGEVAAKLFDLGEYPGIVISNDPEDRVVGEVYELRSGVAVEVLKVLDAYEGIGPGDPEPHEYRRDIIRVDLKDGNSLNAWAYVLAEAHPSYPRIHASDYLVWMANRRSKA